MISKKDLRQKFRRLLPTDGQTTSRSVAINKRLVDFMQVFMKERSGYWASYQPSAHEPDIRPAMAQLPKCDFVFPRVNGETLSFLKPLEVGALVPNKWGILEPDPSRSSEVPLSELKGLLIPGLAFDLKCNRLGRGGGYYDRALAEIRDSNPEAIKIGIALERQISSEDLPTEPFDIPMNWVVTEKRSLEKRTHS